MADISWLNYTYRNYHSDTLDGLVPDTFSSHFTRFEYDPYRLDQGNMDYQTAATYILPAGRLHSKNFTEGSDALGIPDFYTGYITTTQLIDRLPNVGDEAFLFRMINEDGSGGYCRMRVTGYDYTGPNADILQHYKFTLDRGYFTDVNDPTTYTAYAADYYTMLSNHYYAVDSRLYTAAGFILMSDEFNIDPETALPVFLYAAYHFAPSSISAVPITPTLPLSLPEIWGREYYPNDGTYGRPQDGTSSGGAFYGCDNANLFGVGISIFNDSKLCRDRNTTIEGFSFSPEAGYPSEEGGMEDPSFDDSSDTIDIPAEPVIGVSNVGFVNVYKTGQNSLQNMGVELFPPLQYTVPPAISSGTVVDALVDGINNVMTWLANIPSFFEQINASTYINYIIDCHVIPVTPSGGSNEAIKVGNKTLSVHGDRLSSDYVTVDCGSISLAEYYQNHADFLTGFKLYLPFVGFVPAKPEWFYRESLNVTYRFNIIDGSFMAYVRSTGNYVNNNNSGKTIVGQYGGNACVHLPITGATYASMVSGLVGAGAGAVAGAAAGSIPAIATSALAAAQAHGDIAQSNAYSSSVSFLGCRRPFVLIERPVSSYSETYQKEEGIPSNVTKKLGTITGFNIIGNIHLDGIAATDDEKAEIERLLHEGIIL